MQTIYKPWGKEEWIELNDKYCYKRIYINEGYKTSYQYHNIKKETNYLVSGVAELWLENNNGTIEKKIINENDFFTIEPTKKHRIIALTDVILQEVSTPEVDDIIRVEDDTNRKNGKIELENKLPSVLILSAGLGNRLEHHTKSKHKSLIPINNKAIISYIIEKFPKEYEIIITIGYKKDSLIEYCKMVHRDRNFKFIEVDKWEDPSTMPGYSAFLCKDHLQKPFYLIASDCLIDSNLPHIDGNWIGVFPTSYPEKYDTIKIDNYNNVIDVANKNKTGFENAFIGFAAIYDYGIFWEELKNNSNNYELVFAWKNVQKYKSLKAKKLEWLDTGNLDDLEKTKIYFKDNSLSSQKNIDEIVYKIYGKILKFNANENITKNKFIRGKKLENFIPKNLEYNKYFIQYNFEDGKNLYEYDSLQIYLNFLKFLEQSIEKSSKWINTNLIEKFYIQKTHYRNELFIKKYGKKYFSETYKINNISYSSLNEIIKNITIDKFQNNVFYSNWHGDLHFDNIIYNNKTNNFFYIDWRESFSGDTNGGDIYYDLGKLYAGCIFPFVLFHKKEQIKLFEGSSIVNFSYNISESLLKFTKIYEDWIVKNGFNLNTVKMIAGLAFLNIAPLHEDIFNKIFLFKSIELLNDTIN